MTKSDKKKSIASKVHDIYDSHSILPIGLEAISSIIPLTSVLKEILDRRVNEIGKDRRAVLLDELARGEKLLTPEIIQSEDFIHSFMVIYEASIRTRRREKIRLFARLLLHAMEKEHLASNTFEEFTGILGDLSMREFEILRILKELDINQYNSVMIEVQNSNKNFALALANKVWEEFEFLVNDRLEVSADMLSALLTRIARTGLYETITATAWNYRGGKGNTTKLFEEFSEWIVTSESSLT